MRSSFRPLFWPAIAVLLLALAAVLVGYGLGRLREKRTISPQQLQVTVLDAGHGEAAWVRTPGGRFILIGGGPPEAGPSVVRSLRRAGAERIDLLILPYPYSESIGGIPAVLAAFPVTAALEPGGPRVNQFHDEVRRVLDAKKIPVYEARADDHFAVDGASVDLLAPAEPLLTDAPAAANNALVARIGWGRTGFLFAGGIERAGEDALIARYSPKLPSDWLRAARFGSREASSPEFLKLVSPDYVVVSVGSRNRDGYPHGETLQRLAATGAQLFRTDVSPSPEITFTSDGTTVFPPDDE